MDNCNQSKKKAIKEHGTTHKVLLHGKQISFSKTLREILLW